MEMRSMKYTERNTKEISFPIGMKFCDTVSSLALDGRQMDFEFENGKVCFEKTKISSGVKMMINPN